MALCSAIDPVLPSQPASLAAIPPDSLRFPFSLRGNEARRRRCATGRGYGSALCVPMGCYISSLTTARSLVLPHVDPVRRTMAQMRKQVRLQLNGGALWRCSTKLRRLSGVWFCSFCRGKCVPEGVESKYLILKELKTRSFPKSWILWT